MATLLEIMTLAARLAREGSSGTVGADSTTRQLRDPALRNTGRQRDHLAGSWLLLPDMVEAADQQRQCTEQPFAQEVGGLTVTVPWSTAPAEGDPYYIFNRAPALADPSNPVSWQMAVNDLLSREQIRDRIQATVVTDQTRRFTIAAQDGWTPTRASVVKVYGRTDETVYSEYDGSKNGRWFEVFEDSGTGLVIETSWEPGDDLLMVDVLRPRPALATLASTTDYDRNVAAWGTVWRFYELMGESPERTARAQKEWQVIYQAERPGYAVQV